MMRKKSNFYFIIGYGSICYQFNVFLFIQKKRIPLVPRRPSSQEGKDGKKSKPKPKNSDETSPPPPEDPDERLIFDAYKNAVSHVNTIVSYIKNSTTKQIQKGLRIYPQYRSVPYRTQPFSVTIFITLAVSRRDRLARQVTKSSHDFYFFGNLKKFIAMTLT
jgi:hypothetical protein